MVSPDVFRECIVAAAQGEGLTDRQVSALRESVAAYPWFMTARLLCSQETCERDALAELHYSAYPRPAQLLEKISLEEFGITREAPETQGREENLIDKFLQKGEYRIVPDDETPDDDEAAVSGNFDLSDDFVSEELAEIYLAQGLNREAKEIYERLSLLNPEKSIYFAEIIGGINCENPGKTE